jgi:hypothetical protein
MLRRYRLAVMAARLPPLDLLVSGRLVSESGQGARRLYTTRRDFVAGGRRGEGHGRKGGGGGGAMG